MVLSLTPFAVCDATKRSKISATVWLFDCLNNCFLDIKNGHPAFHKMNKKAGCPTAHLLQQRRGYKMSFIPTGDSFAFCCAKLRKPPVFELAAETIRRIVSISNSNLLRDIKKYPPHRVVERVFGDPPEIRTPDTLLKRHASGGKPPRRTPST